MPATPADGEGVLNAFAWSFAERSGDDDGLKSTVNCLAGPVTALDQIRGSCLILSQIAQSYGR